MSKFDIGGSPAAPYFGEGGRQEATEKARAGRERNKRHVGTAATAGPAEAAAEATKRAQSKPENLRTQAEPASTKAEDFDTKSRNAVENGQGEPVGDPKKEQPGTAPRAKQTVKEVKTTSGASKEKK